MFRSFRFAILIAGLSLALTAAAQPAPPDSDDGYGQDQADPPTRVARLSFLRGAVSFVPAGENEWVEAQMNRPLVTGDKLWTDGGSRAELEVGPAAIRIDQQTSFDFLNLDDRVAQVELTQGSLNLRVRRLYDEQSYEVDTPTLAFVINRVGEYRIDVSANGQSTLISVLHGGGDAYGEGGARFRVEEGQSVSFNDAQLRDYVSNNLPPPDDFDNFALQRDGRWDHARSREFVSEDVIGYQDLDDNGDWQDVPEYGHVWYPTTVAADWTPYHSGHWGWVGAYGWTWVDEAPWGFAPFHYGRWAHIGNRWGWCPGPVAERPVYAPALVAFVGGGVGISVGGPVGWFPLGPRDVYFPGYHTSRNYFTTINFSNTRVVDRVTVNNFYGGYSRGNVDYSRVTYMNRNVPNAVVAVPANVFVGARPVAAAAIAVTPRTFVNTRVSGFAAVAPTRASLAFTGNRPAIAPPAVVVNRKIIAASTPPAPAASFAQRQTMLQKNPGVALNANQLRAPIQTIAKPGAPAPGNTFARQNVNVVTSNGQPSRSNNAQVLPRNASGPANANNRPLNAVNANVQNAKPGAAVINATPVPARTGTGAPERMAPQNGNPQATHLDSSRFAHPNTGNGAPNAGPANNQPALINPTPQNGRALGQQADHARAPNANLGNEQAPNRVMGQPATAPHAPMATNPNMPTSPNANANTPAANQVIRQPDYHAAHPAAGPDVNQRARNIDNPNANAAHNAQNSVQQPQQMRVAPNNTVQQQQQQQQQQPQRVQQPIQRPVEAVHAPVQQQLPPPQPRAVVPPPQQRERPAPPAKNDKKSDDDKKRGGG